MEVADNAAEGAHMQGLKELLGSDHRQTFEFFYVGLQGVVDPTVDRQELMYNASVLAHHAQVSAHAENEMPTPATLADTFDNFVLDASRGDDSEMMEAAAAQCLLLAGFFEDQMRRRHTISWYAKLGAGFFHRAASCQQSMRKAQLLGGMARRFEPWRRVHAELARELRDLPYLMAIPPVNNE
jgi:hypothetical protein